MPFKIKEMQRLHLNFKDVLVYEKKFKIIFNNTEYSVFKERLENCCLKFSKKLKILGRDRNYISFIDYNNNCDNYHNVKCDDIDKENNEERYEKEEEIYFYEDKDIKDEIFSTFVDCINGEEIKIKEDNSIGLMILSIEFGYERLKKECEEYISKEHSMIRKEIKEMIEELINNKKSNNDKRNQERKKEIKQQKEKDLNDFERVIGKYFNIAIEDDNEMLKNLPVEILNRIIHNSEFSIENLNKVQKHLFIELIVYKLRKEGKSASILMDGISIKVFSNSDIRLIMEEKSFIVSTMKVGEDEIERMINNEEKLEETKNEIVQLKEEMKEMKIIFEKFKREITTKIGQEIISEIEEEKKIIEEMKRNYEIEKEEKERKEKEIKVMKEIKDKEMKEIKDKEMKENETHIKEELEILKTKVENIESISIIEKEKQKQDLIETFNKYKISNKKGICEYFKENYPLFEEIEINGDSIHYDRKCLPHIIGRNNKTKYYTTDGEKEGIIEIKFQKDIGIIIDKYYIHSHDNDYKGYNYSNIHHLRNWKIEGRKMNGEWIIIDEKANNCGLNDNHRENIFEISRKQTECVSSIRLTTTGYSNDKSYQVVIRNLEFFGKLVYNVYKKTDLAK